MTTREPHVTSESWLARHGPTLGYLVGGLLVIVLSIAEFLLDDRVAVPPQALIPPIAVGVVVMMARKLPLTAAIVAALSPPFNLLLGAPGPGGVQLLAIILLIGRAAAVLPLRRAIWSLAVGAAAALAAGILSSAALWEGLFTLAVYVAGFGVGLLVRRERSQAQQLRELAIQLTEQRETAAAAAVMAERARIARDVHDSVAHQVSVMVLQIGGLRRLLPERPDAQEVLRNLEGVGREAIDEMRRVVGLMREPAVDEHPSLTRVGRVLAPLRESGMPIEFEVVGDPVPLPPLQDIALVRVVQESLSNVVRHAGAAATAIEVAYLDGRVRVTVTDDGVFRTAARVGGSSGHGVRIMRERMAVAGGSLTAGPLGGGWRVVAEVPVRETSPVRHDSGVGS
ncbi:sensor histidine kinase [Microbacterium hibisci]|uniref:sensor histidine kinase n=1 Tax=Microbacterium hibisci TaxID=2036000 RepID=UPI0019409BAB|nr:histidine kinase [Microbacterium hibisci]